MVLNNFAKFWYSHADLIDGLDVARTRPFLSLGMVRYVCSPAPPPSSHPPPPIVTHHAACC
ncbi:hypothetical protein EON67_07865 [archaeon]|nr:MAG: hypothetical protein EON67_07865 [archaeon]